MIIAAELRQRAREAMKAYLPFALLVTLLASIPSLVLQMAASFSGNSIINAILQYQYAEFSMNVVRKVIAAASQTMTPGVRMLWYAVPVLYLMFPFLNIGRNYFTLRILRGANADVSDLFARVSCFFKAILLEIMMTVKMILWGLPGFGVMLLGSVLYLRGVGGMGFFTFLYGVGFALMCALMIRANLHYMLATILMADIPEKSAWRCLKESIGMMKQHVMQLLSVLLSFVLYLLLSEMAVNLLAGISYPIALVINLILNLLITCYMRTTVCAYYEARMKEKSAFEPAQTSELEDETGME
ncbi:MAG: DUF975 family protein [Clostridia bacterium]|nr:DUF975 family protein [Clostridia bacterium]